MHKLHQHHSNISDDYSVSVSINSDSKYLKITYRVISPKFNTSNNFSATDLDNWGLWEFDVVEAFLQKGQDSGQYLEIQASPLSQRFALRVIKPREETIKVAELDFTVNVTESSEFIEITIAIALDDIPGKSDALMYGNIFACLGPKGNQHFFALKINSEIKPDFHRPDLFCNLLEELA